MSSLNNTKIFIEHSDGGSRDVCATIVNTHNDLFKAICHACMCIASAQEILDSADEMNDIKESLLKNGVYEFEGDPPLELIDSKIDLLESEAAV